MSNSTADLTENTKLEGEELSIASELTNRLTLNGGQVPATAEVFWKVVGITMSLAVPEGSALLMARTVLEHLGETWEEDYEVDGRPSLDAYEALLGRIIDKDNGDEDNDEDDDATGDLAAEQQILVSPIDLAVTTLVQWIESKTLILDPDWQRAYVWKTPRKRRFVESMFMNLPIPPVLLFEDKDSRLYVIDGRQRLETIYRYSLGSKDKSRSFTTFGKSTPGWEDGKPLSAAAGKRFDSLPDDFQRRFSTYIVPARKFMNLERRKLYEVFKRYNTGGDKLNPAEIRNAVYQGIPLHEMIYKLAGEGTVDRHTDQEERFVATRLRSIMKGKVQRYGRYNFVGRVLAFTHCQGGSVANVVNKLMDKFGSTDVEPLRKSFIRVFNKTEEWFPAPFCAEQSNGKTPFHEWVATIQMTSVHSALGWLDAGLTTEEKLREFIDANWTTFIVGVPDEKTGDYIGGVLQDKQNTTTHWDRQTKWIDQLRAGTCEMTAS